MSNMPRDKRIVIASVVIGLFLIWFVFGRGGSGSGIKVLKKTKPHVGQIRLTVATTGVVEPQNRLEIKPSINGRIEEILVREGDRIKKGDVLAYMSSTERAALVDASRSKEEEVRNYWSQVYKQTPIISPIDGEVIVRCVEPGQTVTTSDPVLVLSDRLIVSAQFDETDIGRVRVGQEALIALDAYPDVKIQGVVDHIAYESELVNNVNIYDVDILPSKVPDFFRSGMSANVEVVEQQRNNVLLIPVDAVIREGDAVFVTEQNGRSRRTRQQPIEIGLNDEKNVEVISGLSQDSTILVKVQPYSFQKKETKSNPFMPWRRGRR